MLDNSSDNSSEKINKLKALNDFILIHPFYQQTLESSLSCLKAHTPTFIVGVPGVGVTTLAMHLEKVLSQSVFVTAPFLFSAKQSWQYFHLQALRTLESHDKYTQDFADKQKDCVSANLKTSEIKKHSNKRRIFSELRDEFVRTLVDCKKSCVIINNAQHLFSVSRNSSEFYNNLSYFNSLLDSGIDYFLIGNYQLIDLLYDLEQLCPHVAEIQFPSYWGQDHRIFQKILKGFQPYLTISEEPEMQDAEFFYIYSIGRVGIFKDWMIRALSLALENDDVLERTAMPNARRKRLLEAGLHNEERFRRLSGRGK